MNCLNVSVCHACALRWGVTHVGNYHYWALLTLSRDHHFRYRKCARGRRSLEAAFRRKRVVALAFLFCIICFRIVNFNIYVELRGM